MKKIFAVTAVIMAAAMVMAGCSGSKPQETAAKTEAANTEAAKGEEVKSEKASDNAAQNTADVAWPTKTLQLICPFAAGGDSDANARWAAKYLTEELGIDVVVVNTDGNGGAVGARAAKDAPNDGSTALISSTAFLTNELSGAIDFGLDEFEFSCIVAENPGNIICVNKNLGVNNFQELIDYSKANPGKLKLAYNTGATTHAIALQLIDAGVDANLVDAGASSDRIAALLGGHVDIIINSFGSVKDYLTSGDFIGLGLTGERNAEFIPDYPCLKEQGYEISFPSYFFIAFPKGTNPAYAEKISEAMKHIIDTNTDYAEEIKAAYLQSPTYYDAEEGLKLMNEARESIVKYTKQFQAK